MGLANALLGPISITISTLSGWEMIFCTAWLRSTGDIRFCKKRSAAYSGNNLSDLAQERDNCVLRVGVESLLSGGQVLLWLGVLFSEEACYEKLFMQPGVCHSPASVYGQIVSINGPRGLNPFQWSGVGSADNS